MNFVRIFTFISFFGLSQFVLISYGAHNKNLINVNEDNWRDILNGEWMLEFHAPWCPACRDLRKAWEAFADWSEDLGVNIAEIDVTISPGLSGRFLVTALPTIYHVKDGVFRQYLGPRDKEDFIAFLEEKKWNVVQPMPSWKHPDTFQMTLVSYFFKVSMAVRDLHNYLIEKQNIPAWGSYAIFGVTILVLGCILGFVIVYLIDCIFPTALNEFPTVPSTGDKMPKTVANSSSSNRKKQQNNKKSSNNKNASNSKEKKSSDVETSDETEQNLARNSQSEGETSGNDENVARLRKKAPNGTAKD